MNFLKTLTANFLGAAAGTAVYQLITSPLVFGHVDIHATLMAMFFFGLTFSTIATSYSILRRPSLISNLACGVASVVAVGFGILCVAGSEHMVDFVSADALLPIAALLGLAALLGTGGHLAARLLVRK